MPFETTRPPPELASTVADPDYWWRAELNSKKQSQVEIIFRAVTFFEVPSLQATTRANQELAKATRLLERSSYGGLRI